MAEFPYLIAIALIQQEENRAMPLGGKSIKEPIDLKNGPGEAGEKIALELLLRVLEISDKGFIRQAAKKRKPSFSGNVYGNYARSTSLPQKQMDTNRKNRSTNQRA